MESVAVAVLIARVKWGRDVRRARPAFADVHVISRLKFTGATSGS